MGHPPGLQAITDQKSAVLLPFGWLAAAQDELHRRCRQSAVWAHVAVAFQRSRFDLRSTSSPPEHGSGITAVPTQPPARFALLPPVQGRFDVASRPPK